MGIKPGEVCAIVGCNFSYCSIMNLSKIVMAEEKTESGKWKCSPVAGPIRGLKKDGTIELEESWLFPIPANRLDGYTPSMA